jgi:hypothetical protein
MHTKPSSASATGVNPLARPLASFERSEQQIDVSLDEATHPGRAAGDDA